MAYEAGTAYLTILPSFKGGGRGIADELVGQMGPAGQRGGAAFAGGMQGGPGRRGFASAGAKAGGLFVAAFAAVGLGEIVTTVKDYLTDAVSAASDLAETQSKIGQVFGESSEEILSWSKTTADALGQSQQTALDGAATFGIFGAAAGLAGDDLRGFSTDMVTLAADLASFNNTSPEEAIEAIGAALRGESEPIRRYGVLLDDATLKARAMTLGVYDGTGALSAQQRTLAAQAEILAQTTTQQGDFARTSDGLANSQRRLEAQLANVKTEIGTALLPVVTDLFRTFADVGIPMLKELAAWFTENEEGIRALVVASVSASVGFVQAVLTMIRIWAQFADGFITVADNVLRFWFQVAAGILDGAELAFGWVPGVGDKIRDTRARFTELRTTAEAQLGVMRVSADRVTQSIRAGEQAAGSLRDAVGRLDGFTATVRIRAEVDQQLRNIPGTSQYIQAQARAHGGPVVAGRPYLVGEQGPELIVPKSAGTVLTASQTAGAMGGTSVSIGNVYGADPRETASAVVARLRDANATFGLGGAL